METVEELKEHWEQIGCTNFKEIQGIGLCAIRPFIFTFGLLSNLDENTFSGRWCYDSLNEAVEALNNWDGIKDPPGMWRKYKGVNGDYGNVNHPEFNKNFDIPSPFIK